MKRNAAAFSLVEVTLALAVVSFAFLSVLGLMPLGLRISRETMDTSVKTLISQRMNSELQFSDFTALGNGNVPSMHFDDQGAVLTSPSDPRLVYSVKLAAVDQPTLPGGAASNASIRVLNFVIEQKSNPTVNGYFSVVVANTGASKQ